MAKSRLEIGHRVKFNRPGKTNLSDNLGSVFAIAGGLVFVMVMVTVLIRLWF